MLTCLLGCARSAQAPRARMAQPGTCDEPPEGTSFLPDDSFLPRSSRLAMAFNRVSPKHFNLPRGDTRQNARPHTCAARLTVKAMRQLLSACTASEAGVLCVFTEGGARDDVIALGDLPVNDPAWL